MYNKYTYTMHKRGAQVDVEQSNCYEFVCNFFLFFLAMAQHFFFAFACCISNLMGKLRNGMLFILSRLNGLIEESFSVFVQIKADLI